MKIVIVVNLLASVGILILLTWLLRTWSVVDPIILAFVFSAALPWLCRDIGLLDPFAMLFVFGAIVLIDRRSILGLPLCAAAVLTHEAALWLLVPVLGIMWLYVGGWRIASALVTSIAAAAALWLFSTTDFTWPPMPVYDAASRAVFKAWQLGQSARFYEPQITWAPVVFSMLPCGIIAAEVWRRRDRLAGLAVVGAVLTTWSMVLLAKETERFLAWGPIAALLVARSILNRRVESADQHAPEDQLAPLSERG